MWYNVNMNNYTVYIEQDEDGVFIGSVPTIPGCYTQGETLDILMTNLHEVIKLSVRNKEGQSNNRFVGVQNIELAA
jgi:predicted RNase H-like HicB family nuclease